MEGQNAFLINFWVREWNMSGNQHVHTSPWHPYYSCSGSVRPG
jgi:hypothetical protein